MSKPRKKIRPEMFASASFSAVVKKAREEIKSPDLVRRLCSGDREAYALAAGVVEAHIRWFEKTPEGKRRRALGKELVDEYMATVFGKDGVDCLQKWRQTKGNAEKSLEDFLDDRRDALQRGMADFREKLRDTDGLRPLLTKVLEKYVEDREGDRRQNPRDHAAAIEAVMIEGQIPDKNRQHYYRGVKYLVKYMNACIKKSEGVSDAGFKLRYGMERRSWSFVRETVIGRQVYDLRT